jgi:hypothetical protein
VHQDERPMVMVSFFTHTSDEDVPFCFSDHDPRFSLVFVFH